MKKFKLSPVQLAVIGMAGFAATLPIQAQTRSDEVVVTGSSIRRIVSDEALPVQVITKEEIQATGAVTTEELLAKLPALQSLGGAHSSLDGAGGVSNYGQATPSLRGLGDAYTLVLINGRPADGNLNLIPLAAINRVEILQDGASSVYGSDAIAGVINFILNTNFQGVEISAYSGTPTRTGGGQKQNIGLTVGKGDYKKDGFNITASFSVESEKELIAADRQFARTGTVEPYLFGAATGQGNIEGGWKIGNSTSLGRQTGFGTSPGSGYGNPMAALGKCEDIGMVLSAFPSSKKGSDGKGLPYCAYDSAKDVRLVPQRDAMSATVSGKLRLNNNLELFGDAIFSKTDLLSRYQPSPARHSFFLTDEQFVNQGIDPALIIRPTNPNYKIAADYLNSKGFSTLVGQPLAITSRVFDFGPRTNKNDLSTSRFVGGLKGEFGAHAWEVAAFSINSTINYSVPEGYFYQTKLAKVIASRDDWNPWATAEAQTADFKQAVQTAKYAGTAMAIDSFSRGADAKITGPAFKAPGGQAQYAGGLQYVNYGFSRNPDAALASGDIAGLGGAQKPLEKDRSLTALFGELSVPVTRDLEINGSARHDNYSDFGGASTYKTSARWKLTPSSVVRASLGTGFKAPSLSSLWTPQVLGTSAQFTDPKFPQNANLQVNELSGGNPDLKPEKSKQNSIGIVLTPAKDFTVAVDAWRINIDGKITTPSTQEIVSRFRSGDPAYANLVVLGPDGTVEQTKAVSANVGSAAFSGVDLNASYRTRVANGVLGLSMYGTYMTRAEETSPSGVTSKKIGTTVEENGDPVIGADSGGVVVRWKHLLTVSYTTGPWRLAVSQNFYTGYRTGDRQWDGEKHFVPDQSIYDLQAVYTGMKNVRLTMGVKNVFDKNPPMYIPVSNQFAAGYDISMYDPRSRFAYISASYKF
jgi:iron complex outermembrane receptor protein